MQSEHRRVNSRASFHSRKVPNNGIAIFHLNRQGEESPRRELVNRSLLRDCRSSRKLQARGDEKATRATVPEGDREEISKQKPRGYVLGSIWSRDTVRVYVSVIVVSGGAG